MGQDDEFLRELSAEAADVSNVPTEANAARLRTMAVRMVELSRRKDEIEEELKAVNVELWGLRTSDMVSLMTELDQDSFGLASAGVDIKMVPYYHANIRADWPEEQREAGFSELDRVGGGDIVKNVVSVRFGRSQAALTTAFLELLGDSSFQEALADKVREIDPSSNHTELPARELTRAVQWNTLTAFVKGQVERGTVLDLEKLGATVGSIVNIEKRK